MPGYRWIPSRVEHLVRWGMGLVPYLCHSLYRLYNGRAKGRQFGSKCNSGDRIGCGIEPVSFDVQTAQIFFTKNGKRVSRKSWVGSSGLKLPKGLWEQLG